MSSGLYLLPEVQLADEQIEQVKVAAVEEQVDEAQHGRGAHHLACEVSEPHYGLDDSHGDEVKAREGGDHWVPLQGIRTNIKLKLKLNFTHEDKFMCHVKTLTVQFYETTDIYYMF